MSRPDARAVASAGMAAVAFLSTLAGGVAPGPPPFRTTEGGGTYSVWAGTGNLVVVGLATLVPSAPFTIERARPKQVDPGVELLAVRVVLWGRGTTAGGLRAAAGAPGSACSPGWPVDGYGRTYPADGLRVEPGFPIRIVYYVRSSRPGRHRVAGLHLEFRRDDGRRGRVSDGADALDLVVKSKGGAGPPGPYRLCDDPDEWTTRVRGYPS